MRTRRLAPLLVLIAVCCSSATTTRTVSRPLFAFQSNVWVNLHHFLRAVARGEPVTAKLTAEERAIWDRAVATYRSRYMNRDVHRDEGMVVIKATLR